MKPVIIIATAFVLLIPATAYGAEGYFDNNYGKVLGHAPTVCLFQPKDPRVDEERWERWVVEMNIAIDTWRSVLEQSGSGYWKITTVEVPLSKLDLLNEYQCDIKVKFLDKPPSEYPNALGVAWPGSGDVVMVYVTSEYCGMKYSTEYNVNYKTFCFRDDIKAPKRMTPTFQHELGHTFGLGHFVTNDYKLYQHWFDSSGFGAPSIMTQGAHSNFDLEKVTQIDVEYVREIYGSQGFGKKTSSNPIFNERIIPETIIESSLATTITLSENSQSTKVIQGNVPDKLYKRGMYLEIVIQKPDGTTEYKATSVSKTRHAYSYPLILDYSFQSGRYEIVHQFNGEIFYREEIHVSKEPSISIFSDSNSKSGEYLTNMSIQGSNDDITFNIIGGELFGIIPDVNANSLILSVDALNDGSLSIAIPRTILDSTINGDDDEFFVLVDGESTDFVETKSISSRALTINFPAGAEEIEIIGTFVIPEFGSIVMLILVTSIIAVMVSARKFQVLK